MSRNLEYTQKKFHSGAHGAPVGECVIVDIDIATLGATKDFNIHDEFSWGALTVSCQAIWSGLTGTLDGVVELQQSNDGEVYDSMGVSTILSSAAASDTLEASDFSGKFLGLKFTKGSLTAGILRLIFIVKHH